LVTDVDVRRAIEWSVHPLNEGTVPRRLERVEFVPLIWAEGESDVGDSGKPRRQFTVDKCERVVHE
jgi:hypothetical protein